jgi:hypothetical protein
MKANTMITLASLLLGSGFALAADDVQEHKQHHPDPASAATQGAAARSGGEMSMMSMDKQMQKMRAEMEEIHRTKDPDKRDELIGTHMKEMQDMMKMMQGEKSMMGKGMGMKGKSGDGSMDMMDRQQMMEKRMDMMQMMMDQMMQNQAAVEETKKIRIRRHDRWQTK